MLEPTTCLFFLFYLDDIRVPGVLLASGIRRINFHSRCVVLLSCRLLMIVCTSDIGAARRFRCGGLPHQVIHERGSWEGKKTLNMKT